MINALIGLQRQRLMGDLGDSINVIQWLITSSKVISQPFQYKSNLLLFTLVKQYQYTLWFGPGKLKLMFVFPAFKHNS